MDNKTATTLRQEFQPTLRSNMQKTLWLLLDGEEHGLKEMREFAGDAVQTRVRDLRKHSGVQVEESLDESRLARYRLLLSSIDEDTCREVFSPDAKPR